MRSRFLAGCASLLAVVAFAQDKPKPAPARAATPSGPDYAGVLKGLRFREIGPAATKSRLPRRASNASVAESARTDHMLSIIGKKGPYL